MSAKRRRVRDVQLNFRVEGDENFTYEDAKLILGNLSNGTITFADLSATQQLALMRAVLTLRQAENNPDGVPIISNPLPQLKSQKTRTGKPGKPSSLAPSKMEAQYRLDTDHFEVFRQLDWGNVPPNKAALAALVRQMYPADPESKSDPTNKREEAIKKAITEQAGK